jgi:hypothetical protein
MSTEAAAAAAENDDTLKTPPAEQQPEQITEQQEQDEAAKLWAELPDDGAEKVPEKTGGEKISNEFIESQDDANKDAVVGEQDKARPRRPSDPPPADDIWAKASPELRAAHEAEMAALRKTANDAKAHAGRMRKQFED